MHQSLSTVPVDGNGNRQKLPAQTLPDVDFHNAVAGLGSYPMLERALGLVIDLEVPLAGVPASGSVRVQPSLRRARADSFHRIHAGRDHGQVPARGRARAPTSSMACCSCPDPTSTTSLSLTSTAVPEKILDFSYNLARLGFGDAGTSIDTPDNYGLPSLRSAGFSIARVDRATRLVSTFDTASSNNNDITTGVRR